MVANALFSRASCSSLVLPQTTMSSMKTLTRLALEQLLNLGMEYFWCTVDPIWKSVEGVSAERRSDCT